MNWKTLTLTTFGRPRCVCACVVLFVCVRVRVRLLWCVCVCVCGVLGLLCTRAANVPNARVNARASEDAAVCVHVCVCMYVPAGESEVAALRYYRMYSVRPLGTGKGFKIFPPEGKVKL